MAIYLPSRSRKRGRKHPIRSRWSPVTAPANRQCTHGNWERTSWPRTWVACLGCGVESVTWSALKTHGAVRSHHSPPLTCRSHTKMALRAKKHDHIHEPTHKHTEEKAYEQSPSKLVYYTDVEKYLVVHYKHALVPLAPFRLTIEGNYDIFLIRLPCCGNMPLSAINIIFLMLEKTVPFGKHYAPPPSPF